MTNKNAKYASKMLAIVGQSAGPVGFSLSAPSKVGGAEKIAFSLPAGPDFSCPGATEACSGCYAQKGRHQMSNVQNAFARNWRTLRQFEEANDTDGAVAALSNLIKPGIFRIHESGDFHSQWAVDMWTSLAKRRTDVKFWFYTRSFDLDFSALVDCDNVTGWASTDNFNGDKAKDFVQQNPKFRHAYGPIESDESVPDNTVLCPVTTGKLAVDSACKKCRLCTDRRMSKNIGFYKH